jgi:hypothetical protein
VTDPKPALALGVPLDLPPVKETLNVVVPPAVTNLTERFEALVFEAVRKHALGDDVAMAVSMTVLPQGDGGFAPAFVLVLSIPGATIGSRSTATAVVGDLHAGSGDVEQYVIGLLDATRTARSEQLRVG